ncbi:hypothetical protein Bbelb_293730 [Branchiostoma belcheri]|nr:hypothetical protein Bbelb_293730 [Branchiostoma belcheri]
MYCKEEPVCVDCNCGGPQTHIRRLILGVRPGLAFRPGRARRPYRPAGGQHCGEGKEGYNPRSFYNFLESRGRRIAESGRQLGGFMWIVEFGKEGKSAENLPVKKPRSLRSRELPPLVSDMELETAMKETNGISKRSTGGCVDRLPRKCDCLYYKENGFCTHPSIRFRHFMAVWCKASCGLCSPAAPSSLVEAKSPHCLRCCAPTPACGNTYPDSFCQSYPNRNPAACSLPLDEVWMFRDLWNQPVEPTTPTPAPTTPPPATTTPPPASTTQTPATTTPTPATTTPTPATTTQTPATTTQTPATTPDRADAFRTECLRAHNRHRARHNAPDLTWDERCARFALQHATRLKNRGDGRVPHTSRRARYWNGCPHGENIAYMTGATCAMGTDYWYEERPNYNPNNPVGNFYRGDVGHFTQVVWKSTEKVGCGIDSGFMVCIYEPSGNVLTRSAYRANVEP